MFDLIVISFDRGFEQVSVICLRLDRAHFLVYLLALFLVEDTACHVVVILLLNRKLRYNLRVFSFLGKQFDLLGQLYGL